MLAHPLITGTAALGVCGAAAAVLTHAALSPGSQLFGRTLIAANDPREVALTFDDGPNTASTAALLDVLAEHSVRATFFMVGRFVRDQPALARRVHEAGHLVGNHTMTHPWLAWQPRARVQQELRDCNRALEDALGAPVRYFRAPHGARRPAVLRVAHELGLTPVQWNVMGKDWLPIGVEGILRNVRTEMAQAERNGQGADILLHDGWDQAMGGDRSATVAVTRVLLQTLPAEGKCFVTVDAWG
jgi:peptidoglycan/xylan/chitin deacetylase (PgdA/CDA1 family)